MAVPCYRCESEAPVIREGLDHIRAELEVPHGFSPEVIEAAEAAAKRGPRHSETAPDRTEIELVTIDPPGSMDLDQAFAAHQTAQGWRVFYAIADVAAWVEPNGAIDTEARARGFTMYFPDQRTPLHPSVLSEGAASLLPDQDRQALLWSIDLDDAGNIEEAVLSRALVRSRAKLSYRQAAELIEQDDPRITPLREIGLRRETLERERGAVSLQLPQQEVRQVSDSFELSYDESLPIEGWNAQISLLTGIAAAKIMLDGGVGILRTLPVPEERTISELRRTAAALEVDWPSDMSYPDVVRSLNPNLANEATFISQAARGLRGAGYEAFDGSRPQATLHSAIAAEYAHVTAPLRRLGDRFANECVLALCEGNQPADWAREALPELPKLLGRARNREGAVERSIVDLVEAALLSDQVGTVFSGLVIDVDDERNRSKVQLREPAVVAYADGVLELGKRVELRLTKVDVAKRMVRFEAVR